MRTNGKFTFLLIGDGKTKPSMQKLSKDLGINNNTIFTGFVDNPREVLPIIDIGCLTSKREGMGIVLLEYMAFRKPVVSTNAGGIPEVVQEGINGFLVDPGDYKSMAGKILELARDVNLRDRMGQEGFSILNAKFTDTIMVNNIEKLYDQSLEAAGVTKE
ncbi:MAG: glycosyltransferase [Thermodesulfobacteriota bacterium]